MNDLDLDDIWGDPKEYKGVKLYPVKMKEAVRFYSSIGCLMINKNESDDFNIIRMSYLEFLFFLVDNTRNIDMLVKLQILLTLVFQEQSFTFDRDSNKRWNLIVKTKDNEDKEVVVKLTTADFEKIKTIILKQNMVETNEDLLTLPEKIREKVLKAKELTSKGEVMSLESQILSLACMINQPMNIGAIKGMTIYQFMRSIQKYSIIEDSRTVRQAQATGMVKIEGDIPSWLTPIKDRSILDEVTMSEEEFNKIAGTLNENGE